MKVELDPKLLRELKKLDRGLKEKFYKAIEKIVVNPEIGKPLQYEFKGCRRVRVDPFRIVPKI